MPLRKDIEALKGRAQERRRERFERRLTVRERARRQALELATPQEREELKRLTARVRGRGTPPDPVLDSELHELSERLMRRVHKDLADEMKVRRDLLWLGLNRSRSGWRAQGRHRSTPQSDHEYWAVDEAHANRRLALVSRGAPVLSDPDEVGRIIGRISTPGCDRREMLRLVGWGDAMS